MKTARGWNRPVAMTPLQMAVAFLVGPAVITVAIGAAWRLAERWQPGTGWWVREGLLAGLLVYAVYCGWRFVRAGGRGK